VLYSNEQLLANKSDMLSANMDNIRNNIAHLEARLEGKLLQMEQNLNEIATMKSATTSTTVVLSDPEVIAEQRVQQTVMQGKRDEKDVDSPEVQMLKAYQQTSSTTKVPLSTSSTASDSGSGSRILIWGAIIVGPIVLIALVYMSICQRRL